MMSEQKTSYPWIAGKGISLTGRIILVVDDDPTILQLCQSQLQAADLQVFPVTNPREGLEILENSQVDLLLADIRMPEMDGFQLIDQARTWQPDLAVVVMTGFATIETALEALHKGADGLVLKPFHEGDDLLNTVFQALQENRRKRDFVRLQALRPLFDLSRILFSQTEIEQLQDLILKVVTSHFQCSNAALYRRGGDQGNYQLVARRGYPPIQQSFFIENPELAAKLWEHPVLVNRQSKGSEIWKMHLPAETQEALMSVPVSGKEDDSLLVASRDEGDGPFWMTDLEVFTILAQQAAIAIENARLYAELHATIKRLEVSQRALIQTEKVATAGRLTVSIAHEINNPLQAVHNCLHLARRSELTPAVRESYIELAQTELGRLMATVQRMLDYYRPGRLERYPTDINGLIERVLKLLDLQLKEHSIGVHLELAAGLPQLYLVADQIQQVIFNIILNSMDAMPAGGDLFVKTFLEQEILQVQIEDTGPGISEEEQTRIFEHFTSKKKGGIGLGLPISEGIISAHGGRLELVPDFGRGACFRISLPIGERR
jgi:signal transduction histidine kinase/CheY-like chemotaxis protein